MITKLVLSMYCPGACWSFSATGAMEGINQIVTGYLTSLSEQELIDCDRSYNSGCGGGLMDYVYQFVVQNKGIDSEEDYPYKAAEGSCNKNKVISASLLSSYFDFIIPTYMYHQWHFSYSSVFQP